MHSPHPELLEEFQQNSFLFFFFLSVLGFLIQFPNQGLNLAGPDSESSEPQLVGCGEPSLSKQFLKTP